MILDVQTPSQDFTATMALDLYLLHSTVTRETVLLCKENHKTAKRKVTN